MTSVSTDRRFGVNGSLAFKAPVRVASTANLTLSGLQTVDGVTVAANDRVLVKDQANSLQNGIYLASTSSWRRDVDANGNRDLVRGTHVCVTDGTANGGRIYRLVATNPVSPGSTAITFALSLTAAIDTLSFLQAGTGAQTRSAQDKLREHVSVFDFMTAAQIADVQARTKLVDVTAAIQAAIDYLHSLGGGRLYFPSGTYKTTAPLLFYQYISPFGDSENTSIIEKTTNTVGTGTSRARSAAVTDVYANDAIIQIWHDDTASGTVYAYGFHMHDLSLVGSGNTYAIYAPRISQCSFERLYVSNVVTLFRTHDAWLCGHRRITGATVATGWLHADDGSGLGTGTSCVFERCWTNFDNSGRNPSATFDLFGLTYSKLDACASDNGTRTDNTVLYLYNFNTCIGIKVTNCGAESARAGVISAISSRLSIDNFRTFGMTGNAAWGTIGGLLNDASTITYTGCSFGAYTSPGTIFNQIIQNGARQTEIDSDMPSGGNSFIGYGGSSTRAIIKAGAMTVTAAGGTYGLDSSGNLDLGIVGSGLRVAEGSNAKQGTAVLSGGAATVANTSVTANSRIFLTNNTPGGTPGFLRISSRTASSSFVITSSSTSDTSTIAYQIFEPG